MKGKKVSQNIRSFLDESIVDCLLFSNIYELQLKHSKDLNICKHNKRFMNELCINIFITRNKIKRLFI